MSILARKHPGYEWWLIIFLSGLNPNSRELFMYKPHCFLASDHDIGGFMDPFKRDPSNPTNFQGELSQADYLAKNIWGSENGTFRKSSYFADSTIKEGPLTMMIGKELFDSVNQAYFLKKSFHGTDHPEVDMFQRLSGAGGKNFVLFHNLRYSRYLNCPPLGVKAIPR